MDSNISPKVSDNAHNNSVITDNGACFTSREFQCFLKRNNVTHIKTPAYLPSSNRMTEREVQVVKAGFKEDA